MYYAGIVSTVDAWLESGPYSHGILSFAFCLYIGWQQRSQITIQNRICPLSIGLVICISIIWWLGHTANVLKIEQLAVYLLLIMTVAAIGGWKMLRILCFPFLIILLVIPVWDFLQKPLQDLSTLVTFQVLRIVKVPTLLEGYQITVPGGRFLVEEACSGLGFLLTALMLTIFYTFLNRLNWAQSWALAGIAVVIAILANWIRIVSILLVGNYWGMDHPIVTDHLTFGWVVFSIALIPFFIISHQLFPGKVESTKLEDGAADPGGPIWQNQPLALMPMLSVCIALAVVPVASQVYDSKSGSTSSNKWLPPDQPEGGIVKISTGSINWDHSFIGADDYSTKRYRYNGLEYNVLVVQYTHQEQGRELINVNNRLYSKSWNELGEDVKNLGGSSLGVVRVKSLASGINGKRLIAYWYVIGGEATSSSIVAKLLEIYGVLTGNRSAVLVAIAVDNQSNSDGLLEVAHLFYQWSID